MAEVGLYYKGLMEEEEFFPYTPEESAKKARGSWYEVWFDVLKASPTYTEFCNRTGEYSEKLNECHQKFGDLRDISFEDWWKARGYQLFAEPAGPQAVVAHEVTTKTTLKVSRNAKETSKLVLEIPLNLHPTHLKEQIDALLRQHSDYYHNKPNRWDHSQAEAHLHTDSKIDKRSVYVWLEVYAEVQKGELTQAEICRKLKLNPRLFKDISPDTVMDYEIAQKAANETSKYLKKIKRLMAHASEMTFPCIDDHRWAVDTRRGQ